jgi:hypothetical protein
VRGTASQLARLEAYAMDYEPSPEVLARAAVVGHIAVVHDFEGLMLGYRDWHAEARLIAEREGTRMSRELADLRYAESFLVQHGQTHGDTLEARCWIALVWWRVMMRRQEMEAQCGS